MQRLNGLSFGHVWSYGDINAFKDEFKQDSVQPKGTGTGDGAPKASPNKEPVDSGLSRYLSSTSDVSRKQANLARIEAEVMRAKLEGKQLPEQKTPTSALTKEKVRDRLFSSADEVRTSVDTLVRMLEKKMLSELRSEKGKEKAELSADALTKIRTACQTGVDKALTAASLQLSRTSLSFASQEDLAEYRNVLLNSALGVAEMMFKGQISEDAVITLMQEGALYDEANELDVAMLLRKSAQKAKAEFVQEDKIRQEIAKLDGKLAGGEITKEAHDKAERMLSDLFEARRRFARVLDFEIHAHDPEGKLDDAAFLKQQLQDAKLRLQQFRYDLERCSGEVGKEFGHGKFSFYGIMEKIRRSCSNWVGNRHLDVRFQSNKERNAAFRGLLDLEKSVSSLIGTSEGDADPLGKDIFDRLRTACAITHEANNGARKTQADGERIRDWRECGNFVLDHLRATGGKKEVSTEVSLSALIAIGSGKLTGSEVSGGGFVKTTATVTAEAKGAFKLKLTIEGGVKGNFKTSLMNNTVDVEAEAKGSHGLEVSQTFASKEELITFCHRNAPKLLQSLGKAFVQQQVEEAQEPEEAEVTSDDAAKALVAEFDDLQNEIDELPEDLGEVPPGKLEELRQRIAQLPNDLAEIHENLAELRPESAGELPEKIALFANKLGDLSAKFKSLEGFSAKLQSKAKNLQEMFDSFENVKGKLGTIASEIESKVSLLGFVPEVLDGLQATLDKLPKNLEELKPTELMALKDQLVQLPKDLMRVGDTIAGTTINSGWDVAKYALALPEKLGILEKKLAEVSKNLKGVQTKLGVAPEVLRSLKDTLDKLPVDLATVKNKLGSFATKIESMNNAFGKAPGAIDFALGKIGMVGGAIKTVKGVVSSLPEIVTSVKKKLEKLPGFLKGIKDVINDILPDNDNLSMALVKLNAEEKLPLEEQKELLLLLKGESDRLDGIALLEIDDKLEKIEEGLAKNVDKLRQDVDKPKQDVDKPKQDVDKPKQDVDKPSGDVKSQKSKLAKLKVLLKQVKGNLSDTLPRELEDLPETIEKLQKQVDALDGKLDGLQGKLQKLEATVEKAQKAIDDLPKIVEGVKNKLEAAPINLKGVEKGVDALAGKVEDWKLKEKLGALQGHIKDGGEKATKLSGVVTSVSEALKKASSLLTKDSFGMKVLKFLGNVTGLRIHKTKNFNEVSFEKRLHDTGVIGELDTMLAERKNALAIENTTQWVTGGSVGGSIGVGFHGTSETGGTNGSKKEALKLSAGVGGKIRHHASTKALMTAKEAFAWHTAAEMLPLVQRRFNEFADWIKELRCTPGELDFSKAQRHIVKDLSAMLRKGVTQGEGAVFWFNVADKLRALVARNEQQFAALSPSDRKSPFMQEIYARTTALLALAGEFLAKQVDQHIEIARAKGEGFDQMQLAGLLMAEKTFRTEIAAVLNRPTDEIDYKIFQKHLQFGEELQVARSNETKIEFTPLWNLELEFEKANKGQGGSDNLLQVALASYKKGVFSLTKNDSEVRKKALDGIVFEKGRVLGSVTVLKQTGEGEVIEPWKNTDSMQFDLEIKRPVNPASILTTVSKMCAEALAKDPKNERLRASMNEALSRLGAELGKLSVRNIKGNVPDETTGAPTKVVTSDIDLKGVPVLGEIIASAGLLTSEVDTETEAKGVKLSLRFEDGAFSQVRLADFVSNVKTMEIGLKAAKAPFSLKVSKADSDSEEYTTFEALANPSLNVLLGRCKDVRVASGIEEMKNFLRMNQSVVNRMLKEIRNPGDKEPSKFEDPSIVSLRDGLLKMRDRWWYRIAPKKLKAAADDLLEKVLDPEGDIMARMARNPGPGETDEERLELVSEFMSKLLDGYNVLLALQQEGKRYGLH